MCAARCVRCALRARVALDLTVLDAGDARRLGAGIHIAFSPAGRATLRLRDSNHELPPDGGVRIEDWNGVATCLAGPIVLGSVTCVSR